MARSQDADGRDQYLGVEYLPQKNALWRIKMGLPLETPFFFRIHPAKGFITRAVKALGLATNYQSDDPEINKRFIFLFNDAAFFEDIMRKPEMRSALDMFSKYNEQNKTFRLYANNRRLWIEVDGVKPSWLDENKEKIMQQLREISHILAQYAQSYNTEERTPNYARRTFILMYMNLTFLGLGLTGFLAHTIGPIEIFDLKKFLLAVFPMIGFAIAAWFIFINLWLGRSMWKTVAFNDFLYFGLFGLIFFVPIAVLEANRHLPQGAPAVYQQTLIQKSCSLKCKIKSSRPSILFNESQCHPNNRAQIIEMKTGCPEFFRHIEYRLVFVQKTRHQTKGTVVKTLPDFFDSTKIGARYLFQLNPGALGHAWVDTSETSRIRPALNAQ